MKHSKHIEIRYIVLLFVMIVVLLQTAVGQSDKNGGAASNKRTSTVISNDKKVIKNTTYYKNGKLKSVTQYDTSENMRGFEFYYNPDGIIARKFYIDELVQIPFASFRDTVDNEDKSVDVYSGFEINFHENGKRKSKGMIVHGRKVGYWFYYGRNGEFLKTEYYKCLQKVEE